jgi:hypothetical protein
VRICANKTQQGNAMPNQRSGFLVADRELFFLGSTLSHWSFVSLSSRFASIRMIRGSDFVPLEMAE